MSMKIARDICKFQGIRFKKEVMVLCPACQRKTLKLNITDDEAECIRCEKEYKSIEEVQKIEEEKWLEDHKASKYMMQDRSSAQK